MEPQQRTYIAIDLKSFYASVECVERGLDPLNANLVVADESRTQKTICLAVSPSLKAYGISGRARLFEVVQRVREINNERRRDIAWRPFSQKSHLASELQAHPDYELDFVIAPPRMSHYIQCSTRIYEVYLKYIAPEDIHVYSIDEVFIDATAYLKTLKMSAHDLAMTMIREVLRATGITATAGIGTNMYLSKIAMDIVAKKMPADKDGVRIAALDEMGYRQKLWDHQPLTDFWRVGKGIQARLAQYGFNTMGDIARASLHHEDLLYRLLGVNAELLIDHAWGYEPCTIELVKAYRPETHSICSGQVLTCAYEYEKALVVVQEMAEGLALDLLDKGLVTDQLVLDVGYDVDNIKRTDINANYSGDIVTDRFGRQTPKPAHGSENLDKPAFAASRLVGAATRLFERVANPMLLVRRMSLTANHVAPESHITEKPQQLDLFADYEAIRREQEAERKAIEKERRLMQATLSLKKKFGKNALLKGLDWQDGATARERNTQIGGHKA